MKKAFIVLLLISLSFTLFGCGENPNVTAYKERLCASDWDMKLIGDAGIIFRFNEDGTGQITSPNLSGNAGNFTYEVTDATENGDSATLSISPDLTEGQENSVSSKGMETIVWKTTFVAGGLQIDYNGNKMILQSQPRS